LLDKLSVWCAVGCSDQAAALRGWLVTVRFSWHVGFELQASSSIWQPLLKERSFG
jgi:hypothetical protein